MYRLLIKGQVVFSTKSKKEFDNMKFQLLNSSWSLFLTY